LCLYTAFLSIDFRKYIFILIFPDLLLECFTGNNSSPNPKKSDSASSDPQNKQIEQGAEPEKTIEKILPEESKEPVVQDNAEGSSLLEARNRVVNDENVGK